MLGVFRMVIKKQKISGLCVVSGRGGTLRWFRSGQAPTCDSCLTLPSSSTTVMWFHHRRFFCAMVGGGGRGHDGGGECHPKSRKRGPAKPPPPAPTPPPPHHYHNGFYLSIDNSPPHGTHPLPPSSSSPPPPLRTHSPQPGAGRHRSFNARISSSAFALRSTAESGAGHCQPRDPISTDESLWRLWRL